jgi:hypothetical protein
VDISILLCFWDVVYVTRHKDSQYRGQIGSDKTSEIRDDSWDSPNTLDALTFKILTDDEEDYPPFTSATRRRMASNLTPNQVKSSRVSSQNEILKRHNCVRPFNTPDEHLPVTPASDKAGEQNKTTTPMMNKETGETNGRPTMSVPCPTSR